MAEPIILAFGILVFASILFRCFVLLHYRYQRREEDAEAFEKQVEWQLQHELSNAIEASHHVTPAAEEIAEASPLLQSSTRVTFAEDHLVAGSWQDFKAYSKDQIEQDSLATELHDGMISDVQPMAGTDAGDIFVNPKQLNRILKRRRAREIMDMYFHSRLDPNRGSDMTSRGNRRVRRSRGADARFLTAQEVAAIQSELIVV